MRTEQQTGGRLAEISAYDCWGLLESEEIARIAWNGPNGVTVVPVNYTVVDGALWFRTSAYSALGRGCDGKQIAAEVDQINRAAHSGWSVVVSGKAELIDSEDVPDMLIGFKVWPAGQRPLFVRVEPTDVTGRRLLPASTTDEG